MSTSRILIVIAVLAAAGIAIIFRESLPYPARDEAPAQRHRSASVSPRVETLAGQLRRADAVDLGNSRWGTSRIFSMYEEFRDAASKGELLALLDDRSPAVRVYAFKALNEKFPEVDMFGLLKARLTDYSCVQVRAGCLVWTGDVADILIEMTFEQLTPAQKEEYLTWRLSNLSTPNGKYNLSSWPPIPKHHEKIRDLAENAWPGSLIALARYRDDSDVPVIAKLISSDSDDSLIAACIFPHPAFFPRLSRMHEEFLEDYYCGGDPANYYDAIAGHKTTQARDILGSVLEIPEADKYRKKHIRHACQALVKNADPVYTDLIFKFWELPVSPNSRVVDRQERRQEAKLVEFLWKADPQRTVRGIRARLSTERFGEYSEFGIRAMVRVLLDELEQEDAFGIVNRSLGVAHVDAVPALLHYVVLHKPESSIPVLFDRLANADDWHIQVAATKAILAYGQKDLFEKIKRLLAEGAIRQSGDGRGTVAETVQRYEEFSSSPGVTPGYGHWVNRVVENGARVELEDGSKWEISPPGWAKSSLWFATQHIEIQENQESAAYPYVLINGEAANYLTAKLINR